MMNWLIDGRTIGSYILVLTCCFAVSVSSVFAEQTDDVWSIERLQKLFHAPAELPQRYTGDIEVREHAGEEIVSDKARPPNPSEKDLAHENGRLSKNIRLLIDGERGRFVIDRHSEDDGPGNSTTVISIWTGDRQIIHWPAEKSVVISRNPVPLREQQYYYLLLFSRFHHRLSAEMLWPENDPNQGTSRLEDVLVSDDELAFTLRYGMSDEYPGATWHATLTGDQHSRLRMLEQLTPRRGLENETPVNIQRFTVHSWREIGGGLLPEDADFVLLNRYLRSDYEGLDVEFPYENDNTWYRQVTTFRLMNVQIPDQDEWEPELFDIPAEPGTRIADEILKVSYQIGNTYLLFDGTMYKLPKPLHAPIRDGELGALLEQAEVVEQTISKRRIEGASSTIDTIQNENNALRFAVGVALITSAIAIVIIWVRRRILISVKSE